jgi:hypothetical protein
MKAHCLPLDWALKRSSPWCIYAERNKAIPTWFVFHRLPFVFKNRLVVLLSSTWKKTCVRNRKTFSTSPLKLIKVLEANYFPGNSKSWQTDTRSRFRQYIDRAKDWVEWTLEKPPRVKNSVLPRYARQQLIIVLFRPVEKIRGKLVTW